MSPSKTPNSVEPGSVVVFAGVTCLMLWQHWGLPWVHWRGAGASGTGATGNTGAAVDTGTTLMIGAAVATGVEVNTGVAATKVARRETKIVSLANMAVEAEWVVKESAG